MFSRVESGTNLILCAPRPFFRMIILDEKSKKKRRLTPSQWASAQAMYSSGEYTLEEIANKYDVHAVTVQRRMKKHNIERGAAADAIKQKIEEKIEEAAETEVNITLKEISETKSEHLRILKAIDKRVIREMVTCETEGRAIATSMGNLKALKTMTDILEKTRLGRYKILGIDELEADSDELPILEVREMLDIEIDEIRNRQQQDAQEMGL